MKKLITLILVLTGMVSTANAYDTWSIIGTINSSDGSSWDTDWDMTTTDGTTYTYVALNYVSDGNKKEFKIRKDNAWTTSYPASNYEITIPAGTYDLYFKYEVSSSIKVDYKVQLRGAFEGLGSSPLNFTRTAAGTYTATLDALSNSLADSEFKLVLDGSGEDWIGIGGATLTDEGSLVDVTTNVGDGKSYNYILKNSNKQYKTYNFTATNTGSGWTLEIEGNETRGHNDITVSYINNSNWSEVAVYTWLEGVTEQSEWPGVSMTKDGTAEIGGTTYDKYTKTFTVYEPYPESIKFNNNNNGSETGTLTLVDEGTYSAPVYYVVGSAEAFGGWVHNNTTAVMADDGDGTYSLSVNDAVLSSDFDYKVIKKSYYGYTGDPEGWYPQTSSNASFATVTENGKYDLVFYFDPSADMSSVTACVEGSTATLKSIPVTISSVEKSTFSSSHALNFEGKGISAYMITDAGGGTLTTSSAMTLVPASTGLYLEGSEGTEYIPVVTDGSADEVNVSSNYLVAGTGSAVAATAGDNTNFILTNKTVNGDAVLKFYKANGNTVPVGKAYLSIPTAMVGARESLWFAEETTSIDAVKQGATMLGQVYNLNGQRVAQPQKGLYIVNGKKVIIK